MTRRPRIRVMYVVPDLAVGGAERHVTTLMPNLDESRFDAAVVCIGERGELFTELEGSTVKAVALQRSKRQAFLALLELRRELRAFSPDVVITRGYNAELLGRIAAVLTGVRHNVVWVHNHFDTAPRGAFRRITDRLLDRVTSAYFGVADAQLEYLVGELGHQREKIRIIHNGVDPAAFDPTDDRRAAMSIGISGAEHVVGIVAALRPEKDHVNFLRAARLIVDAVPQTKFVIVGDGPARLDVEAAIDELGLLPHVIMAGVRGDVPDLLRSMDVVVLSSYSVECFPMAVLEAMAAGRPAVCTAVGGLPELIEDGVTGYLVPPRDPVALADGVVRLLRDRDVARAMGRSARSRVESEFSLKVSNSATEAALEDVVRHRPMPTGPLRLSVVLDLTYVGGAEVLLLNLFRQFDPAVVVPRLVCLREAGPLADEFRAAGFEVEVLDRSGRFDLRTLPRLIRSFRTNRTDAVLVNHHHRAALALGRVAARLARVPVNIVAAHDMDLVASGKRVLPDWAVSTLALSDALVLLSAAQGEYLHREEGVGRGRLGRTREVVIPNGIVLPDVPTSFYRARARAELGRAEDDFVVGIVARLSAQKAHEVLFRAVATCAEAVPNIHLVVIGGGDRDAELRRLSHELGIYSRTTFLGVRRDVDELLPGFDVACLSSVHEGVPITLLEAMAAGLPVVATDCGSIRDLVEDGEQGFVVPVGDAPALAQRLEQLARDESLRAQFGKSGRALVEREYRIDITARRYEELLHDLVGGRR